MSTTSAGAFGTKVEEYMERLGMQQNELAKKVGLSPSHLSRIVKGTRKPPRVGTVRRMIKALRLTASQADDFCERAGLSPLILQNNKSKVKELREEAIRSKDAGRKEPEGGRLEVDRSNQRASAPSTRLNTPVSTPYKEILEQRLAVLEKILRNAHEEVREIGALVARMQEE